MMPRKAWIAVAVALACGVVGYAGVQLLRGPDPSVAASGGPSPEPSIDSGEQGTFTNDRAQAEAAAAVLAVLPERPVSETVAADTLAHVDGPMTTLLPAGATAEPHPETWLRTGKVGVMTVTVTVGEVSDDFVVWMVLLPEGWRVVSTAAVEVSP